VTLASGLCMIVVAFEKIFKRRTRIHRLPRPTLPLAAVRDGRSRDTQDNSNSSEIQRRNGVDKESQRARARRREREDNTSPQ
jgi:hypothetical protein